MIGDEMPYSLPLPGMLHRLLRDSLRTSQPAKGLITGKQRQREPGQLSPPGYILCT